MPLDQTCLYQVLSDGQKTSFEDPTEMSNDGLMQKAFTIQCAPKTFENIAVILKAKNTNQISRFEDSWTPMHNPYICEFWARALKIPNPFIYKNNFRNN